MIDGLFVEGFKSLRTSTAIDLAPLTLLAGANSAGKSSAMQPLLLMKQTLDASYDPGDLLLLGPNVQFTSVEQLLAKGKEASNRLAIGVSTRALTAINYFNYRRGTGLRLQRTRYLFESEGESRQVELRLKLGQEQILRNLPPEAGRFRDLIEKEESPWYVTRNRCFLGVAPGIFGTTPSLVLGPGGLIDEIRGVIHVPGLRGNPARTYPTTAVGDEFPGTFEEYIASVIAAWQSSRDERLKQLNSDLRTLDLTWKVAARQVDDTQVELRVGRLRRGTRGGAQDMVNIADVGFGVSQTLPVLVALRVAKRNQLVYIEQPEIHLHPRAQVSLASVIADAVDRGVRLVIETHSALLILALQTLVAEGQISPERVRLHWFTRDDDGETHISTAVLDHAGAFGDWPEDFGNVILEAESRYVEAASRQLSLPSG